MNIKEVENLIGIKKTNIRYYEQESLIVPKRNTANNYRDYTAEDIETLRRIKILRILGVSVVDIKDIQKQTKSLNEVLEKRTEKIKEEVDNLIKVKELCSVIRQSGDTFESLDSEFIEMKFDLKELEGEDFMKLEKIDYFNRLDKKLDHICMYLLFFMIPFTEFGQRILNFKIPTVALVIYFGCLSIAFIILMVVRARLLHYRKEDE